MLSSEIVWENKETFGCEYLKFFTKEHAFNVESTAIYMESSYPVQIDYQIDLDKSWRTIKVHIQNRSGEILEITSTGKGDWFDQHGTRIDELNGAIDVDISATPFTNTLPINRVDWKLNQRREFEMVYVTVPTLTVQKVKQTYTFIESKEETRIFHFQSSDFESQISVDEKGFVTDYPQLFTRRY
ncbi:putative glycolipid-binding domain-containing protein [Planococcus shixiaomingii]|uniref:putative glycolipid-binding domain-containing protein n=1 Tax=Planococcus shixiaomingii TaxID=3058393 RepID=UPI002613269A|nr:putative glycolipid-binding domain-containing protein [Planococcus sp. N022]WKA56532.1 putative glycolipid-binding domain-containing protein [Planococcus sp. N022]